mmetsp:Transcript_1837/g.2794  ORF Transcript_1837/g.2794 Transcript_1837/m.2794 type:complete len:289 (+) Transcript_1837:92-958(+)
MDPYNPHPHVHGNVHPHVHHHVQAMNVLHALPIAAVAAPALLLAPDQQHNREHIDFLRREAVALEASAKRLRDLANVLENGGEIDTDGPYETAPLDENGVPKYKGKKRGRKPKKRLRKRNPHAKKRAHTAYTLFVKTTYPKIKEQYEAQATGTEDDQNSFQSKNIISIVAKQWKDTPDNEKEEWRHRAKEATEADQMEDEDDMADAESDDDDGAAVAVAMGHHHQESETVADVVTRLEDQLHHDHVPSLPGHDEELHTHDDVHMDHEDQVVVGDAEAAAYDITTDLAV